MKKSAQAKPARPDIRNDEASVAQALIASHHHVGDGHAGPKVDLHFRQDGLVVDLHA